MGVRKLGLLAALAAVVAVPEVAGRFVPPVMAQTPSSAQQSSSPAPDFVLPEYTSLERWNRAAGFSRAVAAIRISKLHGDTAVTHGQLIVGVLASGWGAPNSGAPFAYVRSVHRNLMTDPQMQFQLVSASATEAQGRYSRSWTEAFGPTRSSYGVTLEEFEQFNSTFNTLIAAYLGLDWTQRTEGDWVVFSVKRRPPPATPFPAGAYTTTIAAEEARGIANLAGTWRLSLADGRYTVTYEGQPVEEGAYAVAGDLVTFSQPAGPRRCDAGATYRWAANRDGLVLERIAELCKGRPIVFATRPLKRAGS